MKSCTLKTNKILLSAITLLLCIMLNLGLLQQAHCSPAYQISGFYLGATPDDVGVTVEVDPEVEEKYFEVEISGVLFFIKVQDTLRLYRIVQEQAIEPNKVNSVLNNLKKRYGMPDKQQIKTGSVRPRNKRAYTTTVKNKAIWNISETQEFIAEIERKRAVYELLDNNPENIKSPENTEVSEGGELRTEGWNPDY